MSDATADTTPTAGATPLLTVIVVTWNCRELALRCLTEIAKSRIGATHEVIVVDNASADGTADAIAASHPDVHLIRSQDNLGFAKANNLAIRQAAGQYLLLLNPDAFPTTPDSLADLLRFLREHETYAAAGCRLIHADGRHQVGDAGYRPSPLNIAIHGLGVSQLMPSGRGLFVVRPDAAGSRAFDVDWICGACLLVRADVVRRTGPLDEGYFMYAEDVEFGCRLRDHGHRIAYLPNVSVLHLQGGTQAGSGASVAWIDSLAQLYARMNHGRYWSVFRVSMTLGFLIRACAYRLLGLAPGRKQLVTRAHAMARYARHTWGINKISLNGGV